MTVQRTDTDIVISGGGIAGMIAAAAFATRGFSVTLVDPAPRAAAPKAAAADLRSTAFLQPARAVLEGAGLWPMLAPHTTPLQVMRIVDAGGATAKPRVTGSFDAAEISDLPFGWNIPNARILDAAMARLKDLPNVDFRTGVATRAVLTREREARVTLSDGQMIAARLLIGADGRNSPVREALGIGTKTTRFGQKALAFAVTHPVPHGNVSTEIHMSGGPFTLVPLPDHNGLHSSAVVWMERGPEAERLAKLDTHAFETEMTARSAHLFGDLTLASQRSLWPIIARIADRFSAERTALIAEAAHVVPPIGAQGLNMSLADIECLLRLSERGLGTRDMLDRYHRERHAEARLRVAGVAALNRASMTGGTVMRDLRAEVLKLLNQVTPIRRKLMRKGMGV